MLVKDVGFLLGLSRTLPTIIQLHGRLFLERIQSVLKADKMGFIWETVIVAYGLRVSIQTTDMILILSEFGPNAVSEDSIFGAVSETFF